MLFRSNPVMDDVMVEINAEWRGLQLTASQLTQLKCGDVLPLGDDCFNQVEIRLEEASKFVGRLGTAGRGWAVEITGCLKS